MSADVDACPGCQQQDEWVSPEPAELASIIIEAMRAWAFNPDETFIDRLVFETPWGMLEALPDEPPPLSLEDLDMNARPVAVRMKQDEEGLEFAAFLTASPDCRTMLVLSGFVDTGGEGLLNLQCPDGDAYVISTLDQVYGEEVELYSTDIMKLEGSVSIAAPLIAKLLLQDVPRDGSLWENPEYRTPPKVPSCPECVLPLPYDSPWYGRGSKHEQVHLDASLPGAPEKGACVDLRLAEAVTACWAAGFLTTNACEGTPGEEHRGGYIAFAPQVQLRPLLARLGAVEVELAQQRPYWKGSDLRSHIVSTWNLEGIERALVLEEPDPEIPQVWWETDNLRFHAEDMPGLVQAITAALMH